MDVTELIPSLNNFVFQNRTVDTTLQIRNIIYRASRSQIAPQLSLTYLTSRTNPVRPPETLGNKWMLDSFSMIKEDAADYCESRSETQIVSGFNFSASSVYRPDHRDEVYLC